MAEAINSFEWAQKLQCPASVCTQPVKKRLCKGISELLWAEIGSASFTNKEVREIRKNILLYKLRHKLEDTNIECIKNITHLKEERKKLKTLCVSLKEEYEREEFLLRQKVEQLKSIKSKYCLVKMKKKLLKIKQNEISTQLSDCKDMRFICKKLMPKTSEHLNEDMLKESLNVVTMLCSGATKREVIGKVSNLLCHISIPTIWNHLYQRLCQDIDNLIKLKDTITPVNVLIENLNKEYLETDGEDIDAGIARLHMRHICCFSKRVLSERKANEYQNEVMKLIENIEQNIGNRIDISDWLCLVLEVEKLKVEEEGLQNEIEAIQLECNNDTSELQFQQLLAELHSMDSEIDKCVENIQQSLILLKSAECTIAKTKDKLCAEYMNLAAIRAGNCNFDWLNGDLSTELNIFYEVLHMEALKKLMLQGNIRAIKHEVSALKEVSIVVTPSKTFNIMPYFPMIQAPIYSLIDCYKNLVTYYTYQRIKALLTREEDNLPAFITKNDYNTMELLILSQRSCDLAQEEIDAFNAIFEAWANQTVQNIMTLVKKTVDNLTFMEWTNRYTSLLYMIENAK